LASAFNYPRGKDFLKIVGIVKTSNYQTLGEPPPVVHLPSTSAKFLDGMILYVRTEQDPSTILASVQSEIHNIDPELAVEDIRTGTKIINQALWWSKIAVDLLGVFDLWLWALRRLACTASWHIP
jgi:hypothetical protein